MKHPIIFFLSLLAGCTPPSSPESNTSVTPPPPPISGTAPALASSASDATIFDVPSLLDKSIDQIEHLLGKPTGSDSPNTSDNELERTYRRQSQTLVITYNVSTKEVVGLFLPASEPTDIAKTYSQLLEVGNLKPNSDHYTVDSLISSEPKRHLIGIAVSSK